MDQESILKEQLDSATVTYSTTMTEFTNKADAEAGEDHNLYQKLFIGPGITGENGVIGVKGSEELEKLRDKMLDAQLFVSTYMKQLSALRKARKEADGGGNSAAASKTGGARRSRSKKSRRGRKNTRSAHKRKQGRKQSRKQ